jgi:phospholipid/cholesterol/gamma-HCH transport system permease protein
MQVELEVGPEARAAAAGQTPKVRTPFPVRWVGSLGRRAEGLARHAGQISTIFWKSLVALLSGQVSLRATLREMYSMGVQSLPIVMVTGVLSGVVTSQQGGYQFTGSVPLYVVGSVVVSSIILRASSPVLWCCPFLSRLPI